MLVIPGNEYQRPAIARSKAEKSVWLLAELAIG